MFDLFTATSAWAQDGGAAGGLGSLLSGPLPMLVLMFAVFYFLLIRPQQKKAKQHKEMLSNLRKGDNVLTSGGLYGRIMLGHNIAGKQAGHAPVALSGGYLGFHGR